MAVEGLVACMALLGTWIFKPDYIKSRAVVGSMFLLLSGLVFDRGLASIGYPLGALGLLLVALLGLLVMVSVVRYHRVLSEVPTEDEHREALRRATEVLREQTDEITRIRAYSERTSGAMERIMGRLDRTEDRISKMRTRAATKEGANIRITVLQELLTQTPLMYLAWDSEQRLLLVEGRDLTQFVEEGRVHVGQPIAEAYAGSAVVEFVASTLEGETSTRLFEGKRFWWAAHYYPRDGGGAVVAIPLSREEVENVRSGTPA